MIRCAVVVRRRPRLLTLVSSPSLRLFPSLSPDLMSGFVDHEVEEASEDEEVSGDDDAVEQNRSASKKKAGGKNRSRVIDSSDEDEDDGESGSFPLLS